MVLFNSRITIGSDLFSPACLHHRSTITRSSLVSLRTRLFLNNHRQSIVSPATTACGFLHCVSVERVSSGNICQRQQNKTKRNNNWNWKWRKSPLDERQICTSFLVVIKMCDFVGRPFGENCGLCWFGRYRVLDLAVIVVRVQLFGRCPALGLASAATRKVGDEE